MVVIWKTENWGFLSLRDTSANRVLNFKVTSVSDALMIDICIHCSANIIFWGKKNQAKLRHLHNSLITTKAETNNTENNTEVNWSYNAERNNNQTGKPHCCKKSIQEISGIARCRPRIFLPCGYSYRLRADSLRAPTLGTALRLLYCLFSLETRNSRKIKEFVSSWGLLHIRQNCTSTF